jgi:N-acetylglucosaminyldiphosphoundecaprenol N-acetyl-beta-D-mannosaminyltransferase
MGRAAPTAADRFSGWQQVGHHHGYVHGVGGEAVIERINSSGADMLLVGMGNPLQERWIQRYKHRLRVPLAIAVGGLFDHWGGNLKRAPHWVRRLGCEWMGTLAMQPYKWRRYLLGNPKFLYRVTRALADDRAIMQSLNRVQ